MLSPSIMIAIAPVLVLLLIPANGLPSSRIAEIDSGGRVSGTLRSRSRIDDASPSIRGAITRTPCRCDCSPHGELLERIDRLRTHSNLPSSSIRTRTGEREYSPRRRIARSKSAPRITGSLSRSRSRYDPCNCNCGGSRPRTTKAPKREPEAEYQYQMSTKVAPPFNTAVAIYKTDILQSLADTKITEIDSDGSSIIKKLNCDLNTLLSKLTECVDGCTAVKDAMDKYLVNLVAEESALQKQQASLVQQNAANREKVTGLQTELKTAQDRQADLQAALAKADAELKKQQDIAYDAQRNCIGKRRRKRGGIGSWLKKNIVKPLEHLACNVFNAGGIKNAKHARGLATDNLNNAKSRVNSIQSEIRGINSRISSTDNQIHRNAEQIAKLQQKAVVFKQRRKELVVVTAEAKQATTKVSVFLGRSQVLKDAVENMVLFEEILDPLKDVAGHLNKADPLVTSDLNVDKNTLTEMAANLRLLGEKFPDYPFVDAVTCNGVIED